MELGTVPNMSATKRAQCSNQCIFRSTESSSSCFWQLAVPHRNCRSCYDAAVLKKLVSSNATVLTGQRGNPGACKMVRRYTHAGYTFAGRAFATDTGGDG